MVGDVGNATGGNQRRLPEGCQPRLADLRRILHFPNPLLTDPVIHSYAHDASNCAVIGGYVLRDPGMGSLAGRYLYGDLWQSGTSPRSTSTRPGPTEAGRFQDPRRWRNAAFLR